MNSPKKQAQPIKSLLKEHKGKKYIRMGTKPIRNAARGDNVKEYGH